MGIIPVPDSLPTVLVMPEEQGRFIRTENIIRHWCITLFGQFEVVRSCVISVTRNADLSFDEDKFEDSDEDFRSRMSKLIRKRANLAAVRLETGCKVGGELLKKLRIRLQLNIEQVFADKTPLNMKFVYELLPLLPEQLREKLSYKEYTARQPEDILPNESVIAQIQREDKLLYFPYDSVSPFIKLLDEASYRDDVLSIKITVYRLADSSKIAHMLCRAAENGKEVTVLVELRARFDEKNNIFWSKMLEESGCRVIYGLEGFKCHGKICLITLLNGDKLSYITQIGTGNYNEKTSVLYSDLSLMTANEDIGQDGAAFFRNMLVGNLHGRYRHLLVAPFSMRNILLQLIEEETSKGDRGYICIKANSLTERNVIDKLVQASKAGVQVELMLRSICCLLPGVSGFTENIHVSGIVGRYLEHARIYLFGRGESSKVYISSADLMTRNLHRRIETACPVYDPRVKEKIIKMLETERTDNTKSSYILPDGELCRKADGKAPVSSQKVFMERSIHAVAKNEDKNIGGWYKSLLETIKGRKNNTGLPE